MKIKYLLFFLMPILFANCEQENSSIEIKAKDYHDAQDFLTSVMVHDIFSPPVASRIYAYPNIAAYETLNQKSTIYHSLSKQLNGLDVQVDQKKYNQELNKRLASLIAFIDISQDLVFSSDKIVQYRDSLYEIWNQKNLKEFSTSKEYALSITNDIRKWIEKDQYKETRTMPKYGITTGDPSRWSPTPPSYMDAIEPHWNKIRPFVIDSVSQFKPERYPSFSLDKKSDFYKELLEVYEMKNQISKKGDESEEIAIARFWDCNPYVSLIKGHFMFASKKITPGAHWIGICKIATKKEEFNFEETVYSYAKTSIAIADAFISCWDEKYRSNLVRPETLINKYIDDSWEPVLQTPPFPEYTSGHSVVSGAASTVLTSIFGDDFSFEDTTEIPYGLPSRKFISFNQAANEAAISRFYGGIHYISAVGKGLKQGRQLGTLLVEKIDFKKKE